MYALSFDMVVSDLKQYYGEPYNKAYYEIKSLLKNNGFTWVQGSTYLTANDDLTALVKVVMELSKIDWFKKSILKQVGPSGKGIEEYCQRSKGRRATTK